MIKIITIIGARPQIIKAAAISRAIKNKFSRRITEVLVHTGQHYDQNMSELFFSELDIPRPTYNLKVGSGRHGVQTAEMIKGVEHILEVEKADYIILYGDTNSTLAGSIAASKMNVPIVHIEAGLRSFNKSMPEEVNRIICDHVSTLLFSPTKTGYSSLLNEGFTVNVMPFTSNNPGIFHCGDVMYDNSMHFWRLAEMKSTILDKYKLNQIQYVLATVHRNINTDNFENIGNIFRALLEIANSQKVVVPLHPRTRKMLELDVNQTLFSAIQAADNLLLLPPVSFLEMISLEKNSSVIITDSGGVQKEAYFFNKPCVILRDETEWVEILETKTAVLAGSNMSKIINSFHALSDCQGLVFPKIFGDGKAAEFICSTLVENISKSALE